MNQPIVGRAKPELGPIATTEVPFSSVKSCEFVMFVALAALAWAPWIASRQLRIAQVLMKQYDKSEEMKGMEGVGHEHAW